MEINEQGLRIYSKDIWHPKGILEDTTRCIEVVSDEKGWNFYQCQRKRGYGTDGLYCKQHAKMHHMEIGPAKE